MTYKRIRETISRYLPHLFPDDKGSYFITKEYKGISFNIQFSFLSQDNYNYKTLNCHCSFLTATSNLFMSIKIEGPEQLIQIINDYITLVDSFIKTSERNKLNPFP